MVGHRPSVTGRGNLYLGRITLIGGVGSGSRWEVWVLALDGYGKSTTCSYIGEMLEGFTRCALKSPTLKCQKDIAWSIKSVPNPHTLSF